MPTLTSSSISAPAKKQRREKLLKPLSTSIRRLKVKQSIVHSGTTAKKKAKRNGREKKKKRRCKLCIIFLLSPWKGSSQRIPKGAKFKNHFKSQTNLTVPLVNLRESLCARSLCVNLKDMPFSIHNQAVGLSALEEKFHSFTASKCDWGF